MLSTAARTVLLSLLGLGALAQSTPCQAQATGHARPLNASPASIRSASFGLCEVDGELIGLGPDYRIRFREGGFEFTPAFGAAVPESLPFEFELAGIRRGDRVLAPATGTAAPRREPGSEHAVVYDHGAAQERYEIRRDGVHQTFVFPAPLAGEGELVVRGTFRTELTPALASTGGGAIFRAEGIGAVTFGGVTGIDAGGRTASGEVRLGENELELVLPAEFVDTASYPLVLDPLIGLFFEIAPTSTWDDGDPDVAYAAGQSRWLVVFERRFALGDVDVRGQLVSSTGTLVGGTVFISSPASGVAATAPSVAYVRATDRFLAVWQETSLLASSILCRTVNPSTGALSAAVSLAGNAIHPDAGGERAFADDEAMVVWEDLGGSIRYRAVNVPAAGAPTLFATQTLVDPPVGTAVNPAISKSAGDFNRFLVVWQLENASGNGQIYARLMNSDGFLQGEAASMSFEVFDATDHRLPDVDGDGRHFLVAWQRSESIGSTSTDVYCRPVSFLGGELVLDGFGPIEVDDLPDISTSDVSVAFTGEQAVIAHTRLDGPAFDQVIALRTVDPFNGKECATDLAFLTQYLNGDGFAPAIASQYAGGSSGDELLAVWEQRTVDGDLVAWRYESPDATTNLFGNCGIDGTSSTGGTTYAPCFQPGNAQFNVHLEGAIPGTPALLLIGAAEAPFACGSCVLHPDLASQIWVFDAGLTDNLGRSSVQIPVPVTLSANTAVVAQWVNFAGNACPVFGVHLANALRLTVPF